MFGFFKPELQTKHHLVCDEAMSMSSDVEHQDESKRHVGGQKAAASSLFDLAPSGITRNHMHRKFPMV